MAPEGALGGMIDRSPREPLKRNDRNLKELLVMRKDSIGFIVVPA